MVSGKSGVIDDWETGRLGAENAALSQKLVRWSVSFVIMCGARQCVLQPTVVLVNQSRWAELDTCSIRVSSPQENRIKRTSDLQKSIILTYLEFLGVHPWI